MGNVESSGCSEVTKELRLKPSIPAFVTFDEGTSVSFTATFPELANWTIFSTNSNLIWEPPEVANSMTATISVSLRENAPILQGEVPDEVCGGAKICAFAIGTIIDACGWNRACVKPPQIEGFLNAGYSFKENGSLDITFSLKDTVPGREWTAEIVSSHPLLKIKQFLWFSTTGSINLEANPEADPIPCFGHVCQALDLPLKVRLTSGARTMERTTLISIFGKAE